MKFFTQAWAQGGMTDAAYEAVGPAYRRHVARLKLPQPVAELEVWSPHDGHILEVVHETHAKTLRLRVRYGDLQRGYADAFLSFGGVDITPAHAALLETERSNRREILYDEVDRAGRGAFVYRWLFEDMATVEFQFVDIEIRRRPVPTRYAE